jgi:hypothetical protein
MTKQEDDLAKVPLKGCAIHTRPQKITFGEMRDSAPLGLGWNGGCSVSVRPKWAAPN